MASEQQQIPLASFLAVHFQDVEDGLRLHLGRGVAPEDVAVDQAGVVVHPVQEGQERAVAVPQVRAQVHRRKVGQAAQGGKVQETGQLVGAEVPEVWK